MRSKERLHQEMEILGGFFQMLERDDMTEYKCFAGDGKELFPVKPCMVMRRDFITTLTIAASLADDFEKLQAEAEYYQRQWQKLLRQKLHEDGEG